MSKFRLSFEGMPIGVLANYMTGAEIAYYRGLGFHTVEQLYAALVTQNELDEAGAKALKVCKQNLPQEKMDSLAPSQEKYSTGLKLDD